MTMAYQIDIECDDDYRPFPEEVTCRDPDEAISIVRARGYSPTGNWRRDGSSNLIVVPVETFNI